MPNNTLFKEEDISFKTARLANLQGFNCFYNACYYNMQGREWMGFSSNGADYEDKVVKCPQGMLQRWLRDKHNLHVRVDIVNTPDVGRWYFEVQRLPTGIINLWHLGGKTYGSYEDALEEGLYKALKLINNQ